MSSTASRLRELLSRDETVLMPGAYDGLVARVMESEGFEALFVSGNAVSTALGLVDLGLVSMTESVNWAHHICTAVDIPVLFDCDTGFGGPLNVQRTIREMERVGVAGMMIEDQVFPKRCGMMEGKQVVPQEEAVARVRAAVEARIDPDTVIIARTDARDVEGLESAIARGKAFAEVGADVVFVESPASKEEMRRFADEIPAKLLANDRVGGEFLSREETEALGHKILTVVGGVTAAVFSATRDVARHLKNAGGMAGYTSGPTGVRREIDAVTGIDALLEHSLRYSG